MVSYGYFLVNGKKVNIFFYWVSIYDIIDVCEKFKDFFLIVIVCEIFEICDVLVWFEVCFNKGCIFVY